MGRFGRRAAVTLTVAAVAIAVPALPAAADTQIFNDSVGEADPLVDIVVMGGDYDDGIIVLAVQVDAPTDPHTDPNWTQSAYSLVEFGLDTNGDYFRDAYAQLYTDEFGNEVAEVFDSLDNHLCTGLGLFDGNIFLLGLDATCIGSPSSFNMNAGVFYDTDVYDPQAPVIWDYAPDPAELGDGEPAYEGPISVGGNDELEGTDEVLRVAGSDRISTSVSVSQSGFGDGTAGAVVLATAFNFPDALVGVPLAAAYGAPLLLTGADNLDFRIATEIERVLPFGSDVFLLGGTGALDSSIESDLRNMGYRPIRIAGDNRYETAVEVASYIESPSQILLATGRNFPDALALGAAAATFGGVLLLTDGPSMPQATQSFIDDHGDLFRTAVGPAISADPGAEPIPGADRYETAVRVATHFFGSGIFSGGGFGLASGTNFPDALSGGARVALFSGPILLSPPSGLAPRVDNYLRTNAANYSFGYAFGGTSALSDAAISAARAAIAG